eukprot:SAG31_NODE_341_length_17459_cov_29.188123_10_plen_81_part_00
MSGVGQHGKPQEECEAQETGGWGELTASTTSHLVSTLSSGQFCARAAEMHAQASRERSAAIAVANMSMPLAPRPEEVRGA